MNKVLFKISDLIDMEKNDFIDFIIENHLLDGFNITIEEYRKMEEKECFYRLAVIIIRTLNKDQFDRWVKNMEIRGGHNYNEYYLSFVISNKERLVDALMAIHELSIDYKIVNCNSVSVANSEFVGLDQWEILKILSKAFKEIEKNEIVVLEMIVSPEIEKLFSEKLTNDFYNGKHLWTADVKIVDNINKIIFIGNDK